MPEAAVTRLADLTTLRVGGPSDALVEAATAPELVAAVRDADAVGRAVLLVGGGSNLLVSDRGWRGVTVLVRSTGVDVRRDGADVLLRVAAGTGWDELVEQAVAEGWAGL
ncbi:MAG: FAD-binding protein, partial [Geodermatophilaceae bacterium]